VSPPAAPGPVATTVWLAIFSAVFVWSAWRPHEVDTWMLEVAPAVIALAVLAATRRRFPLTTLAYWLILAHAVVLMIGGHYTYARVPAFDTLAEVLDLSRNHYDRVGHFFQGFVPALVAREILVRWSPVPRGAWLNGYVFTFCLAVSAVYELIEWGVALLSASAAESFLGTQGDPWDTQADMLLCAVGAITALIVLPRAHERALARLAGRESARRDRASDCP
jgi:putative membrane protein